MVRLTIKVDPQPPLRAVIRDLLKTHLEHRLWAIFHQRQFSGGNYFGNHEKGVKNAFSATLQKMKCVLRIKE